MAIQALIGKRVTRIILTRPAVEAGERLGFLPGSLQEKSTPICARSTTRSTTCWNPTKWRSCWSARHRSGAARLHARPHAQRQLHHSRRSAEHHCEQMKMVLTRQGFNSKMVVTGDLTQIDLPTGAAAVCSTPSRFSRASKAFRFVQFDERDVVRHSLVQRIVGLRAVQRGHRRGAAALPETGRTVPPTAGPPAPAGLSRPHEIRPAYNLPAQAGHSRTQPGIEKFAAVLRDQVARGRAFHCRITNDAELQSLNRNSAARITLPTCCRSPPLRRPKAPSGRHRHLSRARPRPGARMGHSIEDEIAS
jgi:hypothetical protein